MEEKQVMQVVLNEKKYNLTYVNDEAFAYLSNVEIYKLLCNATFYELTHEQNTYRNSEVLEYKGWLLVWGFLGEIIQYITKRSSKKDALKCFNFANHLKIKIEERFNFNHLYGKILREIDSMGQFESFYPRFKEIENEMKEENSDYFKYWCIMTNQMCYEKLQNEEFDSQFADFVNSLDSWDKRENYVFKQV